MRILVLCLALAVPIGCSTSRGGRAYDPNAVTLCVENNSIGYGNLIVFAGSTRFTVYPNDQTCRDVRAIGPGLEVRAASTGATAMGPLRFAFQLPGSASCWHWRVTSSQVLDIVECQ